MLTVHLDRGDFWEFKARMAAFDLDLAKTRATLAELARQRNALVDAFARAHRLDPQQPMTFEDTDCSVTQE